MRDFEKMTIENALTLFRFGLQTTFDGDTETKKKEMKKIAKEHNLL